MLTKKLVELGEWLVMLGQNQATNVKTHASCQTAFVKKYTVDCSFSFPKDFSFSENGILFAESIKNGEITSLFLYWSSEHRADVLEAKVKASLHFEAGEVVGSIVQVATPQKSTWLENPPKWGRWVITAAAIFGALSAIQTYFTTLFGRPHVVIFASDRASSNFHFGYQSTFRWSSETKQHGAMLTCTWTVFN